MIRKIDINIGTDEAPEIKTFEVDDEVYLHNQPKEIQKLIDENLEEDTARFESAKVYLYASGRMIVNTRENV